MPHVISLNISTKYIKHICRENDVEDISASKYDETKTEWQYTYDLLIVFDNELELHFYASPRNILSNENRTQLHTSDTQTLNSNKNMNTKRTKMRMKQRKKKKKKRKKRKR